MKKLLLLWLLFCLFFTVSRSFAASYYFDPDYDLSNGIPNGSYTRPWNTFTAVNYFGFSTGDDLYFRAGSTMHLDAYNYQLIVDWSGTETDPVTIGTYYGNGLFGLGGLAKPIFDGGEYYPHADNTAVFQTYTSDYVRFENLRVQNVYGQGFSIVTRYLDLPDQATYCTIYNCETYRTGRQGMILGRTQYCLIDSCTLESGTMRKVVNASGGLVYSGATLEVSSGNDPQERGRFNTVRNTTVKHVYNEGIGVYLGAYGTTIENCTVFDTPRVLMYFANSRESVVRNCLLYEPGTTSITYNPYNDALPHHAGPLQRDYGLWITCEGHVSNIQKITGDVDIINTYIAGCLNGIAITSSCNTLGAYQQNVTARGCRLVDNYYNVRINSLDPNWHDNFIEDNYSFIYTTGHVHTNLTSTAPMIQWDGNYYNTSVHTPTGDPANGAHFNSVTLQQASGWMNLVSGEVTRDDFLLTGESGTTDTCTSNGHVCCDTGTGTHYSSYDSTCPTSEECWSACSSPSSELPYMDTSNNYGGALYTPIVLLPFFDGTTDGASTTLANDLSAYGNNATLTNPNWATDGLIVNSAGQLVAVPISDLNGINNYTIVMVFTSTQQESLTDYGKFFHYNYPDTRGFQLERNVDDLTWLSDVGGVGYSATLTVQDQIDQTPHVAILVVNDSENRRTLYQDGAYIVQSSTAFVNPTYNGYLYLGGKSDGTRILGLKFHLFAIYADGMNLSDAQILQQNPYQMIANLSRDWESNTTPQPSTTNYRRTTFSTNRSIVTRMER